jgi:hypothetical protein
VQKLKVDLMVDEGELKEAAYEASGGGWSSSEVQRSPNQFTPFELFATRSLC